MPSHLYENGLPNKTDEFDSDISSSTNDSESDITLLANNFDDKSSFNSKLKQWVIDSSIPVQHSNSLLSSS